MQLIVYPLLHTQKYSKVVPLNWLNKLWCVEYSTIQLLFYFIFCLFCVCLFLFYYYYFFLLYNIVLVLPYINMLPPRVYTCSPSWTTSTCICHGCTRVPHPEPPSHLLSIPSLWVIPVHQPQASCILHRTWTGESFLIWYYTCFNAILPNHSPPPTESKRLFYTSVSLLLSRTQGCHYHLSKFHIYALVYCIGVFLSGLLHSV